MVKVKVYRHTADMSKNITSLNHALSSKADAIELDFVMTKDGIPVWTHSLFPTLVSNYSSPKISEQLTLYDVLDINNHRCKLMLDLKYIPRQILKSDRFNKLLNHLNSYDEMQIQTLDISLIKKLRECNFSNFEIGFIVNVLSKGFINGIKKLPSVDFMAISSELWEKNGGIFIDKCNSLYADVKKLAWTWATREETEERINNFLDKKADGIITDKPDFVRTLISKRN